MRHVLRFLWIPLGCILMAGLLAYWPFTFHSHWVCGVCGAVQWKAEKQMPFSRTAWSTRSSLGATPVSRVAEPLVGEHLHAWKFAHGRGNGSRCALGDGREIARISRCDEFARFLNDTLTYDGSEPAELWLSRSLDPQSAILVLHACTPYPESASASQEAYRYQRDPIDENWEYLTIAMTSTLPGKSSPGD